MSASIDYSVSVSTIDGESVNFIDTTLDYGGSNIDYSDIRIIRFYRGDYTLDISPTTLNSGGIMSQWREYQSGVIVPFIYDNKIVPAAGRFIPFISGVTVQSNSVMSTTGRYSPYIAPATYLPTATKNTLILTPSDFGLTDTVFPDRVYYGQYEVYIDSVVTTNVVDGMTYIVYGTGTCIYAGSTYRVGEVFTASDNGGITLGGGAVLKELGGYKFKYFTITYNIEKSLAHLTVFALANPHLTTEIMYKIVVMRAKLDGLKFNDIQNHSSASLSQNTIEDITSELTVLNSQYSFV